jgi:two-component system, cell cycle sensor histidine kinase and response regulator CckA
VLPDLLCVVGFDGRFRDVNPAWERVLGYSREDLLGRAFRDYIHPEDHEPTQAEFEANLEGGETESFENRYRHQNGTWRWMSWSSSIDPSRQLIYGVARDVTGEKEVATALRKSEGRYRTLVESARDAILTLAPDGTVASANQAFAAITGWTKEAWLGRSYEELLDPGARPLGRELFGQLDRDEEMPVFEVSVIAEDGSRVPVEIKAAALDWIGGKRGVLLVARDVRARKALDERLRRVQRLDAVGRLSAGVAHDFNNVLGVVLGEADFLLATEGLPKEAAEGLRHIRKAADQGAGLAGRLMALSRNRNLELRPLELNEVVEEFTPMLQRLLNRRCAVEMKLSEASTLVLGDSGLLEQALMNLAINASDAMPEGGTLTLSTAEVEVDAETASRYPGARKGRSVHLAVTDTGKGIPPEDLTQIFEPLFTTKGEGEGTGLGLPTVYTAVQQHRGWLDVESEPGMGTTFHLYFPAADEAGSKGSRP